MEGRRHGMRGDAARDERPKRRLKALSAPQDKRVANRRSLGGAMPPPPRWDANLLPARV
jgi:hypothetical protein